MMSSLLMNKYRLKSILLITDCNSKSSIIILELMIKGRAVKRAPFLDGDIAKHC